MEEEHKRLGQPNYNKLEVPLYMDERINYSVNNMTSSPAGGACGKTTEYTMTPKGAGVPIDIPWYKVILLGDCGVGKTSLIRRIATNNFSYDRVPTTSVEEVTRYVHAAKML